MIDLCSILSVSIVPLSIFKTHSYFLDFSFIHFWMYESKFCINKFFFKCVDFQDSTNSLLWSNCILQGQQREDILWLQHVWRLDNQVKIVGFDGYYSKESSILHATLRQDSIYCPSFNLQFLWYFTKSKSDFLRERSSFHQGFNFLTKIIVLPQCASCRGSSWTQDYRLCQDS